MKTIYKIRIMMSLAILGVSCSDDECGYESESVEAVSCVPFETNSANAGFTVATCYAAVPNEPVGVIFDTRFNSQAPVGDDWGPALNTPAQTIHPGNWTPENIGQVFGIAIDADENIYLASSNIYQQSVFPTPSPNTVSGQVYKCTGPSWTATPFFTVPNTGGTLNGLGNIAYDKLNNQLFVSNLEDGKIYRYDMQGNLVDTYDPWSPDGGSAGIVNQDEQVWGIGVNYESGVAKVYFPRVALAPNSERSIYSVTLNLDGSFNNVSATLEVSAVPGSQSTITDIAFSSSLNEMLVAERGNPHRAKTQSFSRSGGSWSFNQQYFLGGNAGADGENAAGGVDFSNREVDDDVDSECGSQFWATSNFMEVRAVTGFAYGLQGVSYAGNTSSSTPVPNASQDTDLFVDFNGTYNTSDKNTIGDVETFDASECFNLCDF